MFEDCTATGLSKSSDWREMKSNEYKMIGGARTPALLLESVFLIATHQQCWFFSDFAFPAADWHYPKSKQEGKLLTSPELRQSFCACHYSESGWWRSKCSSSWTSYDNRQCVFQGGTAAPSQGPTGEYHRSDTHCNVDLPWFNSVPWNLERQCGCRRPINRFA